MLAFLASSGLTLAPIITVLAAVAAVLGAILNFLPSGWRTYANVAAAGLAAVVPVLTDLSATGETVTTAALVAALVGAVIGRLKAGK